MLVLGEHCENQDWRWSRNGFSCQKHHGCQSPSPRKVLWEQEQIWSSDVIQCWQWTCSEQVIGLGELHRSLPTSVIMWFYDSNLNPISSILWLCHTVAHSPSRAWIESWDQHCPTEIEAFWPSGKLNTVKDHIHPFFLSKKNTTATFLYSFLLYSTYNLQTWHCIKTYILIHYSLVVYE